LSTKKGQQNLNKALEAKKLIESSGKKAIILASDLIMPAYFLGINVGAFVNTACPRISLEGTSRFRKPVLTPSETLVALGEMDWEDLCRKGWFEDAT